MAEHSPGQWFGIVSGSGIALLPPSVPLESVRQVWSDLRLGRGIGAVIDGLVGAFGTSLSQLPHFAVLFAEADGSTRVALRGPVEARLWTESASEPFVVSGLGVTTWNERSSADAIKGELLLPGTSTDPDLPVADGIVLAGRLSLELIASELTAGVALVEPPERQPAPAEVLARGEEADESMPTDEAAALEVIASVAPADVDASEEVPAPPEVAFSVDETKVDLPDVTAFPELDPEPVVAEPEPQAAPREPARAAETMATEAVPTAYDQLLFGETVMSSVESAAVRAAEEPDEEAPAGGPLISAVPLGGAATTPPAWDDHDGETVMVDELLAAAAAASAPAPSSVARPAASLLIAGRPPTLLDRSAVVGTRPKISRVQAGLAPTIVNVDSPNGEISRSHVELRVEGSDVLAVDLNSTNGTLLLRVGAEPVRLQPRETYLLVEGDQLDLGDGVVLAFAGLS